MNTVIQVEVPEEFQQLLVRERGEAGISRLALEAIVVEAVRSGLITRGFGGELLGLGFNQREEFYASHGVTYDLTQEELASEQDDLKEIFRNR